MTYLLKFDFTAEISSSIFCERSEINQKSSFWPLAIIICIISLSRYFYLFFIKVYLQYNNNELLSLLCEIFEVNFNEHRLIYPLLINISSINNDVCECLIDRNIFVTISVSYCRNKNNKSNEVILYAAKLISNFSHFHHDKVSFFPTFTRRVLF